MSARNQVTFHGLDASPALEALIHEKAAGLERFARGIGACRVVVAAPHRSHVHGDAFRVVLEVSVPGHVIVVDHNGKGEAGHDDAFVAVRDAFRTAARRLQELSRARRAARHAEHHA